MGAFFAFLASVLYFRSGCSETAPRAGRRSRRSANLLALAKPCGLGLGTLLEGVEPRGGRYHFKSGNRGSLFWTTFLLSRTVDGPIIKGNVPIVNRQAMSDRENWKTREA